MSIGQTWIAAVCGLVLLVLAFGTGYGLGLDRGIGLGGPVPAVWAAEARTVSRTPPAGAVLAQDRWVDPPYPYSEVPSSLVSMARSLESISRTLESSHRQGR